MNVSELPPWPSPGRRAGSAGGWPHGLAASDVAQRLLVRDASRAPVLDGAVPVAFRLRRPRQRGRGPQGVTTLFMVSAAENADGSAQHYAFVDAAAEAGVRHVVYTSFAGAAADSTFTLGRDHFHTEERIKASGMDWTFLRDNLYLDFLPYFVGEDGVIRGPAGDGVVAAVTRDDIAASAAEVLPRRRPCRIDVRADRPGGDHDDPGRRDLDARPGPRGVLPRRDDRGGLRSHASGGRRRTGRTTRG